MIYIANQPRPSFQQGFARSRGESEYPGLWDGLVGLWAPSLGHQGLTTLRDWSRSSTLATLTGGLDNTDWVIGPNGYTLDFNGSSQYLSFPTTKLLGFSGTPLTAMAWVKPSTLTAVNPGFNFYSVISSGSGGQARDWMAGFNGVYMILPHPGTVGNGETSAYQFSNGVTYHCAWRAINNTINFFINGAKDANQYSRTLEPLTQSDTGRIANDTFDKYFGGGIGQVSLYSRGLLDHEILAAALGASPLTLKRRVYGKAVSGGPFPHFLRRANPMSGGIIGA